MPFFKLEDGIIHSSIFDDEPDVLKIWVTCLALANQQDYMGGTFTVSPGALSRIARIPKGRVEEIMGVLQTEDPDSTTDKEGGRRLLRGPGPNDWLVVTWPEHQGKPETIRKRKQRLDALGQPGTERDSPGHDGTPGDKVGKLPSSFFSSSVLNSPKKVNSIKGGVGGKKTGKRKTNTAIDYSDAFEAFWKQTWGRGNKKAAFAAWEAIEDEDMNAIVVAAAGWKGAFERRDGGYAPHVSTWLNARGWEDDLDAELAKAKGAKGGFDPNVGATPKISEADRVRRRQQVRSAITKHAMHLVELEFEDPEVAAIVQEGIEKLKTLSETVCASEDAKELVEGFQAISDEMLLKISKGWDKNQREEWKKSALEHGKTKDAQHRMYNALARRAVTTGLGIKPITDYDWVG